MDDSASPNLQDALEESTHSAENSRMEGFLYKLEQRPLVGQTRKKYWFVLPSNSPVLYWYKDSNDYNCTGRILLSGAAFIYNPREHGIFEIHVDNKCFLLEAPNNRARMEWLSSLRRNRRLYYQRELKEEKPKEHNKDGNNKPDEAETSGGPSTSTAEIQKMNKTNDDSSYFYLERPSKPMGIDGQDQDEDKDETEEEEQAEARSVFYLREDGELHPGSLEVPPPIHSICEGMEQKLDELLSRGALETQQLEMATKRMLNRARNSFRTLSLCSNPIPVIPEPRENCDRCQELVTTMDQLRNRCYELTDDLVGHQELVQSLRCCVLSAHNQRDALKQCCMESSTDDNKLDFILERESALAKMQFITSELRRDNEALKEENRRLESENTTLNITVEAYQESIRTKDELVLKFADHACAPPPATSSAAIPIVGNRKQRQNSATNLARNSSLLGNGTDQQPVPMNSPVEATEALLVDFGTPTDVAAKALFTETAVKDLNEMKDLMEGYRNQNRFLNNEVLELQKILQSLEERERRLIRQNFDIEAVYYQLKSRYIMLLNHLRPTASRRSRRPVEPSQIQELIDEVSRPHSPMRAHNANSLAIEIAKSSSALATLVSCPQKGIAVWDDTESAGILRHQDPETDSLGFYLSSPRTRNACADFFAAANRADGHEAEKKSNGRAFGQKGEEDEEEGMSDSDNEEEEGEDEATTGTTTNSTMNNTVSPLPPPPPPHQHLKHSFSDGLTKRNLLSTSTQTEAAEMAKASFSSSEPARVISPSSAPCTSFSSALPCPSSPNSNSVLKREDWLLRLAADVQKRSDDILSSIKIGDNSQLVEWLQKWDALLVKMQPLSSNNQLKALIRCGIPHTYRSRVWTELINSLVGTMQSETGKGYYDCLLRKAYRVQEMSVAGTGDDDAALKQIDLDLVRTLPNNKLFETENSPKVASLKNILYAYRFHNRVVEYCQGLNRLGAIGLLYLDESQAFWFLVACVDHLQPPNYYSHSLLGAVIDQRVLLDLVQDKMPALHAHMNKLEVDLSLFTLSWFLTLFVDVLPHNIYIKIFDVFLHEGNKVLFRFALALLTLAESRIMDCTSLTGVQNCLSNLSASVPNFRTLSNIAFNSFNPFPARTIENRRQHYYAQYKSGKFKG